MDKLQFLVLIVIMSYLGCYIKYVCMSILLYADDILLTAASITSLQQLLDRPIFQSSALTTRLPSGQRVLKKDLYARAKRMRSSWMESGNEH